MCSYCDKDMSFGNLAIINQSEVEAYIAKGVLYIQSGEKTVSVGIHYCPLCGENIENLEED